MSGPAARRLLAAVLALAPLAAGGGEDASRVAAGRRLYLEGIGRSGSPVQATVSGDVPLSGGAAACATCHLRSGLGAVEGGSVAARITAPALFRARPSHPSARPAYDEASLARALRDGVDPAGRRLDRLMPRFRLDGRDQAALAAYLRTLGAGPDEGVTPDSIRFATVLTPDATPAAREATLAVLRKAFEAHESRTRLQGQRPWRFDDKVWRRWTLDVWELTGPPEGWRAQLEARRAAAPPFLLLSGAGREWSPVQAFCEARGVPCLLPNVDDPPAGPGRHTVYYGGGLEAEARALARVIAGAGDGPVLQVVGGPEQTAAARALADLLPGRVVTLEVGGAPDPAAIAARAAAEGARSAVLWLGDEAAGRVSAALPPDVRVYTSAGALGDEPAAFPAPGGHAVVQARAWAPLSEALPRIARIQGWLGPAARQGTRGLRVEDQTYFAAMLLGETLMHLDGDYRRDAFLDLLDHASGLEAWSAYWPRLSFAPGQRRLSPGCWIVERDPSGREGSRWIAP